MVGVLVFGLSFGAQDPAVVEPPIASPAIPSLVEDPAQTFRRGKGFFEFGDCARAIETLAALAVPGLLSDEQQQLEVHRMLGVCYALTSRQLESAREFSSLLSIDPDATLDPFLTPPVAVEVFDRQKATMKAQLEEIRRARDRARAGALEEGGVLVEHSQVVRETPLAAAFLPFGLAQAANGETALAIVFGGLQTTFLATNITAYWISLPAPTTPDAVLVHQIAWYTHIVAAMGLALSYGASVALALGSYEDRRVIDENRSKRLLTPDELKKLDDVPLASAGPGPMPGPASPP